MHLTQVLVCLGELVEPGTIVIGEVVVYKLGNIYKVDRESEAATQYDAYEHQCVILPAHERSKKFESNQFKTEMEWNNSVLIDIIVPCVRV